MKIESIVLILLGLFTILGAVMNWDWYMNHRKARLFVSLFGRNGARIFYSVIGLFILGIGIMMSINGNFLDE